VLGAAQGRVDATVPLSRHDVHARLRLKLGEVA
jgi:hypothetical protein